MSFFSINDSDSQANSRKLISAIIPNYNYANYIIGRIDSIVGQTYPIAELIVLDDASTDGSQEIIENKLRELNKQRPEIITKFIKNKRNSGGCVFAQWQKGIKACSCDFFWIAEADDLCDKRFLENVMKPFSVDDKVVLSYSESRRINERGKITALNLKKWASYKNIKHWSNSYINDGHKELAEVLTINNTIINVSSVVFKNSSSIPFSKLLDEARTFQLAGDWYFYSKVLMYGKIAYNSRPLNYFRIHQKSVTATTDGEKHFAEILKVQDEIARSVTVSYKIKNRIFERNKKWRKDLHLD